MLLSQILCGFGFLLAPLAAAQSVVYTTSTTTITELVVCTTTQYTIKSLDYCPCTAVFPSVSRCTNCQTCSTTLVSPTTSSGPYPTGDEFTVDLTIGLDTGYERVTLSRAGNTVGIGGTVITFNLSDSGLLRDVLTGDTVYVILPTGTLRKRFEGSVDLLIGPNPPSTASKTTWYRTSQGELKFEIGKGTSSSITLAFGVALDESDQIDTTVPIQMRGTIHNLDNLVFKDFTIHLIYGELRSDFFVYKQYENNIHTDNYSHTVRADNRDFDHHSGERGCNHNHNIAASYTDCHAIWLYRYDFHRTVRPICADSHSICCIHTGYYHRHLLRQCWLHFYSNYRERLPYSHCYRRIASSYDHEHHLRISVLNPKLSREFVDTNDHDILAVHTDYNHYDNFICVEPIPDSDDDYLWYGADSDRVDYQQPIQRVFYYDCDFRLNDYNWSG
ncbi:hypothetical protein TWF192_007006 [Orbilia oligospora]|nr:hypothetical protein TWF192_007006 [Orbilia oligospora]